MASRKSAARVITLPANAAADLPATDRWPFVARLGGGGATSGTGAPTDGVAGAPSRPWSNARKPSSLNIVIAAPSAMSFCAAFCFVEGASRPLPPTTKCVSALVTDEVTVAPRRCTCASAALRSMESAPVKTKLLPCRGPASP